MLALVHISPTLTIPFAIVLMVILGWYWRRLGSAATPPRQRNIRRFATSIMLITVPLLVLGLSIIDPVINQTGYIMSWSVAMSLIVLLILCAGFDMLNNIRQYERQLHGEIANSLHQRSPLNDQATNSAEESGLKEKTL